MGGPKFAPEDLAVEFLALEDPRLDRNKKVSAA